MPDGKLVALAVQVIEVSHGVIVKRGVDELLVAGEHAREAVTSILAQAGTSPEGARPEDICARLQAVWPKVDLAGLIEELRLRKMLVDPADEPSYPERPDQVLAWNVGSNPRTVAANLSRVSINIVGVNGVSRRLAESLIAVGGNVRIVDYAALRNVRLFGADETLDSNAWGLTMPEPYDVWEASLPTGPTTCLVVCSDFGGMQLLADWNAFAYRSGWHFLPVVLQNLVGLVGPLVVPGETACFQCLLARENANAALPASSRRASELFAFQGQSIVAYHPSMASALGDVAAVELTKHYGYDLSSSAIGNTIEVNLMSAAMQSRPILKAPACPVCSSLNVRGFVRLRKEADLKSNRLDG